MMLNIVGVTDFVFLLTSKSENYITTTKYHTTVKPNWNKTNNVMV